MIEVGELVNTHGTRGELKLLPHGIDIRMLAKCKTLYIVGKPYACTASRVHRNCLLVKLEGVDSMNGALELKGCLVEVRREDVPLGEGEYLDAELLGITARDAGTGEELGKLEEVLAYPAHDIYVVRKGKHEYLIPAVPEFIAGIDIEERTMDIHMMDGLES